MNLSLGELEALALKAAKGAGLDWGLAAEAGKACRWLAAHGFDGPNALLGELTLAGWQPPKLNGATFTAQSALTLGPSLCDHTHLLQQSGQFILPETIAALPVLPFAAQISQSLNSPICLTTSDAAFTLHDAQIFPATRSRQSTLTLCAPPSIAPQIIPKSTRVTLSADTYQTLTAFAHKTYAPATEASRLAGAGAGLSDND